MKLLQSILNRKLLEYRPDKFINGIQEVTYSLNDQGNVGIEFPCDAPADIPPGLMYQFCKDKAPVVALQATQSFFINIQAINNRPTFTLYDELGIKPLDDLPSMQALQNITRRLNRMEIFDADVQETPGCFLRVDLATRAGGVIFFDASSAPGVIYTPNPTLTSMTAEGSLTDINLFMRNINYRSDSQFSGLENIVIDIRDNGCTGISADQGEEVRVCLRFLV